MDTPRAFSTLEMLIAMTVLVLTLGAVVLVSFSNQSILVDSARSADALALAQAGVESIQTLARKDYKLVNPIAASPSGDYTTAVDVATQPDFFTKKITSTVTWGGEHGRAQNISLTALVSDFENPVGADTCSSVLVGDWTAPQKKSSLDIANSIGDSANTYTIGDVDVYLNKLYVAVSDVTVGSAKTLLTFDTTDPTNPTYLANLSVDNNATQNGIAAVRVAGNYAYAANAVHAFYNTGTVAPNIECTNSAGANKSCGQLQIITLTGGNAVVSYTYELPGVTGTPGQGVGNSIFYKDGYVYLGLTKTGSGPEFNIIDVHDPAAPAVIGTYAVGASVSAITVKGGYAYLATPNTKELITLDVSNPAVPYLTAGGFDAPGGSGNGKSMYVVGDNLYFGRTQGGKEFYILNNKNPLAPTELGTVDTNSSVNGLVVRDYLAFMVTTAGNLLTYRIDSPVTPTQFASPLSLGGTASALDCEGNYLFAAANNPRGQLYAIAP